MRVNVILVGGKKNSENQSKIKVHRVQHTTTYSRDDEMQTKLLLVYLSLLIYYIAESSAQSKCFRDTDCGREKGFCPIIKTGTPKCVLFQKVKILARKISNMIVFKIARKLRKCNNFLISSNCKTALKVIQLTDFKISKTY